jgi:predicted  nucleic acid-binding Zn-ribbon protein
VADQIETDVAALKAEAERARDEQNRLQAQAEAAEAEYERLITKLREEFGVSSEEEAETLLSKIDTELLSEMQTVRTALDAARKTDS